MAVMVGSARIDEYNKAHGGAAGDQTGKEVSTQAWYKHSKGWRVFRAKDAAKATKIGKSMQDACNNSCIGYDQYQRLTLYNVAQGVGFDIARVKTACETDCSALVRVCCAYAGIMLGNFTTGNQASVLAQSGAFTELTGSRYTDSSDYLKAGDILVTKTKGHTVIVVTDGPKAGGTAPDTGTDTTTGGGKIVNIELITLKKGTKGAQVKTLQRLLLAMGYKLPKYGADGDMGGETVAAVKNFQADNGLTVDGICGKNTWNKLLGAA